MILSCMKDSGAKKTSEKDGVFKCGAPLINTPGFGEMTRQMEWASLFILVVLFMKELGKITSPMVMGN